jgi:hypothetical protein
MITASTTTVLSALIALVVVVGLVAGALALRHARTTAPGRAADDDDDMFEATRFDADGDDTFEADPAAATDTTPIDTGAVVAELHRRAHEMREEVGWPSGPALGRMPMFREAVDGLGGVPTDGLVEIARDEDEIVSSAGLAALIGRGELPDDWTETAVRKLRRSGAADEHFLLLSIAGVPGRIIGPVLAQNEHITDAGIAWFLEQRVAAGEPVSAETFADIPAGEADELARIFDEEPTVPESVRRAFAAWRLSIRETELLRFLQGLGMVW